MNTKMENKWKEKFFPQERFYLPTIELSSTVWITDPCYER